MTEIITTEKVIKAGTRILIDTDFMEAVENLDLTEEEGYTWGTAICGLWIPRYIEFSVESSIGPKPTLTWRWLIHNDDNIYWDLTVFEKLGYKIEHPVEKLPEEDFPEHLLKDDELVLKYFIKQNPTQLHIWSKAIIEMVGQAMKEARVVYRRL